MFEPFYSWRSIIVRYKCWGYEWIDALVLHDSFQPKKCLDKARDFNFLKLAFYSTWVGRGNFILDGYPMIDQ